MITLDAPLPTPRHALATVTERAEHHGYYTGGHTPIINSHAELRAALEILVMARRTRHPGALPRRQPHRMTLPRPPARHRPADVLRALADLLRAAGTTRLYGSACTLYGVLSVAYGLTVWTNGRVIWWRHDSDQT